MSTNGNYYFELDSTYRNRDLYPNPSSFVVEFTQAGTKSRNAALNPVCYSSPNLVWDTSFVENSFANSIGSITVAPTTTPTTLGINVFKISTTSQFRQIKGFYNGATINIPISTTTYVRRIVDYQPLTLTDAIITVDTSIPDVAVNAGSCTITNPTPLATNTASAVIKFFIPGSVGIDNFYCNYYIQSMGGVTIPNQAIAITSYDGTTHLATLASATSIDWLSENNNYVIRKELVTYTGTVGLVTNYQRTLQLSTSLSNQSDTYVSSYLRMTSPFPNTTSGYSVEVAPYNQERRIVKYIAGDGTFAIAPSGSDFILGYSASDVDNYYVGSAILGSSGNSYEILTYNGTTRSGTINGTWAGTNTSWSIRSATITTPFTSTPTTQNYELERFSKEFVNPFNYNKSLTSVNGEVCYEIELLNLILPNLTLKSGRGGRPAFYPYFYVEFRQVSSAADTQSVIISNNPNSNKMLFRAVVDDTPTPLISPFIKIDGDGMTHIIKFKPTDSFQFSVYHPISGDLFTTDKSDTSTPKEPDPMVQVSASFSFKRL